MSSAYGGRRRRGAGQTRGKRGTGLGQRERRALLQLGICLALFFAVLVGKRAFPEQLSEAREQLSALLGMDTDFKAAFTDLGQAVSEGVPLLDGLGGLIEDVFGGERSLPARQQVMGSMLAKEEKRGGEKLGGAGLVLPAVPVPQPAAETTAAPPTATPEPPPAPTATPQPAVIHVDYDGPELPENATMDQYLLSIETISPIEGASDWWVSSGYGWRDHPVDGIERFHNGVDLAVNLGTHVKSFADGVVDYIGDSPIYGLYTQIRHENGVTTFYAHCNKLYVRKGQTVKRGETIAESGETGNVTGPHLHFELRKDGVLLNPLYYLETG